MKINYKLQPFYYHLVFAIFFITTFMTDKMRIDALIIFAYIIALVGGIYNDGYLSIDKLLWTIIMLFVYSDKIMHIYVHLK